MPLGGVATAGILSSLGGAAGGAGAAGAAGAAGGGGALSGLLKAGGGSAGKMAKTGLSLASGAIQSFKANKLKNEADASRPDLVDPNLSSYLTELAQKKKSLETGAEMASSLRNIDQTTAGTQENLTNVTGGDSGGTIQAMLQAQMMGSRAKNDALASGQRNQLALNSFYDKTLNRIADQKLQLQLQNSQQKMAEWSKMKQSANQNLMAGAANMIGLKPGQEGSSQSPVVTPDASASPAVTGGDSLPADGPSVDNSGKPSIVGATGGLDVESILSGLSTGK